MTYRGEKLHFLSLRQSVETSVFRYGAWLPEVARPVFPLFAGENFHLVFDCEPGELVRLSVGGYGSWETQFIEDDLGDVLNECLCV